MANPGDAISGQFHFSTATVCVAPLADILAINPDKHSIGLTKNVRIEASPQTVDLTQGITQEVVASVTNRMQVTASAEVYEYTAKNLAYGLGLDGSGLVVSSDAVLTTASTAAAATSVVVTGDVTADYTAGSWAFIQEGEGDKVYVFKVASTAANGGNTTITMAAGYTIPALMTFAVGSRVGRFNKVDADPGKANKQFTVAIFGTSIKDKRPTVVYFPKARISRGFGMAFSDSNFGSLPFEITPLVPLRGDANYKADFSTYFSVMTP